ncbi:hypothetical protein [Sphingomonas sp. YL-JM2C]
MKPIRMSAPRLLQAKPGTRQEARVFGHALRTGAKSGNALDGHDSYSVIVGSEAAATESPHGMSKSDLVIDEKTAPAFGDVFNRSSTRCIPSSRFLASFLAPEAGGEK